MTLNLQHLEDLYKNATQGEWGQDPSGGLDFGDTFICAHDTHGGCQQVAEADSCPDIDFTIALHNAFPSLLKTLRAYEEAIEQVRGMEVANINIDEAIEGLEDLDNITAKVNHLWELKRDSILQDLDEATKEINV